MILAPGARGRDGQNHACLQHIVRLDVAVMYNVVGTVSQKMQSKLEQNVAMVSGRLSRT